MFKTFLRVLTLCASLFASFASYALLPTGTMWVYDSDPVSPAQRFPTIDGACGRAVEVFQQSNPIVTLLSVQTASASSGTCTINYKAQPQHTGTTVVVAVHTVSGACPTNSDPVSGGCQCRSGYNESGGLCVDANAACAASKGQTKIVNWTVCFFRTGDDSDFNCVGAPNTLPAQVCSGGCQQQTDPNGPGAAAWRSQTPNAQGLYRGSLDVPVTGNGVACTAGSADAPLNPAAADTPCPGYVGEVNGKLGCYGTADKPVVPTATPKPLAPLAAGNPAAGPKPPSGEGSGSSGAGRTPSAGSGGNAGGPAAAATGGKGGAAGGTAGGTGTVAAPGAGEEQAACGAPGQPVCAVKVDETGMPAIGTTFNNGNTGLDTNKSSAESAINAAHQIQAPAWSFSFSLPTGCTPYQVGNYKGTQVTLNPCAYQPMIHDLMSMVWAAVTAFCLIGMVGRTIRES